MDDNMLNKCEVSNQKKAKRIKGSIQDNKESDDIMQEIERLKMKLENDFNKYSLMKNNHKKQEQHRESKPDNHIDKEGMNANEQNRLSCEENANDNVKHCDKSNNELWNKNINNSSISKDITTIKKTALYNNQFNTIGDIPSTSSTIERQPNGNNQPKAQTQNISIEESLNKNDFSSPELKEIESQLTIDERLSHDNREIRKNACREISLMCLEPFTQETKQDFFDCFNPWVKYCIEETNSYVLPEALNFYIIFNSTFPEFKSSSQKDFFANLERIASFGISNLNDLCSKIIFNFIQDKRLFNQAFTELLKALDKSSIRLIKFLHDLIEEIIIKEMISESHMRTLFEKIILVYGGITMKNSEKKKMCSQMIIMIYEVIEDDLKTILHYLHIPGVKEFEALLIKVPKKKTFSNKQLKHYCLYPKENNHDNNTIEENQQQYSNKAQDQSKELKEKGKEYSAKATNDSEVLDLSSILPNKFFEYNFSTTYPEKMSILEESNAILSKITNVKDKEKNYIELYKTINYSIDEQNILIHLEGIKTFGHVARLLQSRINITKLKTLLESCFDKFKDKKSIVKNELFSLFDIIISNECISIDSFILFVFQLCLSGNKKIVTIVKQGMLEYLKVLMKNNVSTTSIKDLLSNLNEKSYVNYARILIDIITLESQGNIKDLCTDLLIINKGRIISHEGKEQLSSLMQKLPNYRKTLLLNLNDNNNKKDTTSRDYKKNLGRIKSNMSFSSSKSVGNNDNNKLMTNRKEISSTPKYEKNNNHMLLKNNKLNKEAEIKGLKRPMTANMKVINKDNKVTAAIGVVDKQKNNKTKLIGQQHKLKTELSNKSFKEKDKQTSNNTVEEDIIKCKTNDNNAHEQRKKEYIAKRKDDVSNYINSLDIKSLEEYSKIIIRDFLNFINKVSFDQLHESLSFHFNVIFDILIKIINRTTILHQINNNPPKFIEELSNRIIRVIIIYPSINQIDPNSIFIKESLVNILKSIRHLNNNNDEAFILYLIVNVIKFTNKRKSFLEKIDPNPIIVYFLNYIHSFNIENNEIEEMMNEFIEETIHLSSEDKLSFIKKNSERNKKKTPSTTVNVIEDKSNYEYLTKKIKDSEEMIRKKEEENERLKQQLMQYEDEKKNESQMILNQTSFLTESHQAIIEIEGNKINESNNKNTSLRMTTSSTAINEDILKIKEQLNKTTKRLDMTVKRMTEKNKNNSKTSTPKHMPFNNSLFPIKEEESNTISVEPLNNNIINTTKPIRTLEDLFNAEQEQEQSIIIQHPSLTDHAQSNTSFIQDIFFIDKPQIIEHIPQIAQEPSPLYKKLIDLLHDSLTSTKKEEEKDQVIPYLSADSLYTQLTDLYFQLSSPELKTAYINYLQLTINHKEIIQKIPTISYYHLYDFLLTILSLEILSKSNIESIIIILQSIAEDFKGYRDITEMLQVLLFLLRKYFPKEIDNKIKEETLVMLKVITYIIKESIKTLEYNTTPPNAQVKPLEIIIEINELFTSTSLGELKTNTPNVKLYENIFSVIKALTDQIYHKNKEAFSDVIAYLVQNKTTSKTYSQYLNTLCELQ